MNESGEFIDRTIETFEVMAIAINDLCKRVEALEARWPLTEVDRSHDVAIGARVDPSHTGV